MKVYCGAYKPWKSTSPIICDTDTGSYYCWSSLTFTLMRFSKLSVKDPVELEVPSWFVFEYSKSEHNMPDNVVAVIFSKSGVLGFTGEQLGVEYVDALPTTTLVEELIAENPTIDEGVLRTFLYRALIGRSFTPYAARFVACSGAPSQFQLSKAPTSKLASDGWGSMEDAARYFDVFLEKHAWELHCPTDGRVLYLRSAYKDGVRRSSYGYSAPRRF